MIIITTNWVLWFRQTQSISHRGRDKLTLALRFFHLSAGRWIWQLIFLDIDMWEDGTDHVLHPWCLHEWWDHHRGPAKRWQTLLVPLLDILKVMYIKAELFWLGRCQHTFIWSVRHNNLVWKKKVSAIKACTICYYKLHSLCTQSLTSTKTLQTK